MDPELQEHYEGVVWCLMRYGGLDEAAARLRIEESGLYAHTETEFSRGVLLHDTSYFWAMGLLHGRTNPYWWKDFPEPWPPPEEYYEWERNRNVSTKG